MPNNAKPQHSFSNFSHFLPLKSSQVPLCGAGFNSCRLSFGSQLAEVGSSKRRLLVVPRPSYGTLSSVVYPNSNSIKKRSVLQVGMCHEDMFISGLRVLTHIHPFSYFSASFSFRICFEPSNRKPPKCGARNTWEKVEKHPHLSSSESPSACPMKVVLAPSPMLALALGSNVL